MSENQVEVSSEISEDEVLSEETLSQSSDEETQEKPKETLEEQSEKQPEEQKKCECPHSWSNLKKKMKEIDWQDVKTDLQQSGPLAQVHILLFALNILGVIFCMVLNTTSITVLTTIFVFQFSKLEGKFTEEADKLRKSNKKLKLVALHLPFIPFILMRGNCSFFWRAVGNMTGHSTLLYELAFRLYGTFKETLLKVHPCEECNK
ncbi:hypothetical protein M0812_06391 [Anaeramoeba flamelloides]|uniref:Uncharacterized protein n=1 Tax=Anaeramoeba flamelloides TaxID=1746091 RepID=A0AAV8A8Q9_9EUKA|nr:hypothetical protein M0812_06391 [Anaeramoeba flamelloides]|eukprot:Anaeramoba_flamelloidesc39808_g2_i1.p1 GENE.c39808_g2_i1~~c39808_g2_i1.p1  ORF type:complete len:205 (+),score=32.89 c39808_g2_i1:70-684(+)